MIETKFIIIEKNGNKYRKNRNTTGNCIHYSELKCVCCNPECTYNCSIDDELEEELENDMFEVIGNM
jgi:hypothetical protein